MKIDVDLVLDLSEEGGFILPRELRKQIQDGTLRFHGISILKRYGNGVWLDVIFLMEDKNKFIKARFRLSDIYFVGYCKGKMDEGEPNVWYVLSEGPQETDNKSKNASSSSNVNKPLTFKSIKNEDENGWLEQQIPFTGQYSGAKSMVAVSKVSTFHISKGALIIATETLYRIDPTNIHPTKSTEHTEWAKSCSVIPIAISEAVRFEVIHSKIERVWAEEGETTICTDTLTLIKNWKNVSELVYQNRRHGDHQEIICRNDLLLDCLKKHHCYTVGQLKEVIGLLKPAEECSTEVGDQDESNYKLK